MLKKTGKATFVLLTMALAIIGISQWPNETLQAYDHATDLKQKAEEGKLHVNYHKPAAEMEDPAVNEMLHKTWQRGKEIIAAESRILDFGTNKTFDVNKSVNVEDWEIIDSADIDIRFTNDLTQEEASTFNAALFHEERKENLEAGDKFPAILLSPDREKAILFWEKKNGNIFMYPILSRTDQDGKREWFVPSPGREIEAPE